MDEEQKEIIREELGGVVGIDRFIFQKHLQILNANNIQVGRANGTKIGTATDQKIGFYGVTPVDQPATISDPGGGATTDAEARTAINALIDRLQELGLLA